VAGFSQCKFGISSISVVSKAVTCTSCGTFNYISAEEWSGQNSSPTFDIASGCAAQLTNSICQMANDGTTILGLRYSPGYSSEGVDFAVTCSGSSGAVTFANLTSTGSDLSAGSNPVGWGISTGTPLTSMKATLACQISSGIAVGVIASGATQQLTSNVNQVGDTALKTSGSATFSLNIQNVGDPIIIEPWCKNTCTIGTLTVGSDTAVCPASAQGVSSANTGQGFICYVLSASASGSKTVTFIPGGSPTQWQVSAQDISLGGQTTASFDKAAVDTCDSGCLEGLAVTTPSITPTKTGSLLFNFVYTAHHVAGNAGSWVCYAYVQTGDNDNCQTPTTQNQSSWIINSAAGATAADTTIGTSNDPFQSIILDLSYTSTIPAGGTLPQVFVIRP